MSGMSVGKKLRCTLGRFGRTAALVVLGFALLAGVVVAAGEYREDVNGDGEVNVIDAVNLLLIGRANPSDPRADFNGDAAWSIADVTALLDNIRRGVLTPVTEAAIPRIAVSIDSLAFGNVEIGTGLSLYFDIANTGDTTLVVSAITTGDPAYMAVPASLSIGPSDSAEVEVTFTPSATGEVRTTLSILSNDPDMDSLAITLSGTGIVTVANQTHLVSMPGNAFSPDTLTIAVGDTVTWNNTDQAPHTVTSGAGGQQDGLFDSGNMNSGASFTYVFTQAGSYSYYCIYHYFAGMYGMIIVE